MRKYNTPFEKMNVGGGVWRLKWDADYVGVAAMYNSFKVLQMESPSSKIKELGELPIKSISQDESKPLLCYGFDWKSTESKSKRSRIAACCTFYDRQLALVKVEEI